MKEYEKKRMIDIAFEVEIWLESKKSEIELEVFSEGKGQ